MPRFSLIAIIFGLGMFALTFELTRRRRLLEKYAILWFVSSTAIIIVAVVPGALDLSARLLGIAYAPAALLLVSFVFALAVILHLSMVVSRITRQVSTLAQELAILAARAETNFEETESRNDDAPV